MGATALGALAPAQATPVGAGQQVVAVPETVFGFAVSPTATRSGSTIPVNVRRERVGDTVVVTIAPRE